MSKGPQRIRGTQDIAFEEADRFDAVVAAMPEDYDGDYMIEVDKPSVPSVFESHRMSYDCAKRAPRFAKIRGGDATRRLRGGELRHFPRPQVSHPRAFLPPFSPPGPAPSRGVRWAECRPGCRTGRAVRASRRRHPGRKVVAGEE